MSELANFINTGNANVPFVEISQVIPLSAYANNTDGIHFYSAASNTAGGNIDPVRFNTLALDTHSIASRTNNWITVPSGTYGFNIKTTVVDVVNPYNLNRACLFGLSAMGDTDFLTPAEAGTSSDWQSTVAFYDINGQFKIASEKTITLALVRPYLAAACWLGGQGYYTYEGTQRMGSLKQSMKTASLKLWKLS